MSFSERKLSFVGVKKILSKSPTFLSLCPLLGNSLISGKVNVFSLLFSFHMFFSAMILSDGPLKLNRFNQRFHKSIFNHRKCSNNVFYSNFFPLKMTSLHLFTIFAPFRINAPLKVKMLNEQNQQFYF